MVKYFYLNIIQILEIRTFELSPILYIFKEEGIVICANDEHP